MKCWKCSFENHKSIELMKWSDLCEDHSHEFEFKKKTNKKTNKRVEEALLKRKFIEAQEKQYKEGIL